MRRPIIAANWKLHMLRDEAHRFVRTLRDRLDAGRSGTEHGVEVVIAPPFTALDVVREAAAGSAIALAAQDVCAESSGAFTGEVSAPMLADAGCRYCIVGHSERRTLYGETSEQVSRKAAALLAAGIRPIVCVGESLDEREAGETESVLRRQLAESLADVSPARAADCVLAYEPIWAIGTGRTATPEQAQAAHRFIRERLAEQLGDASDSVRIQYGGSVKPDNVAAIMAGPDIDGALVGGASLDPDSFAKIVSYDSRESVPS
jgi:triosephosphate isomerase